MGRAGSWKEGYLSFYDSELGWSTKWTKCKNRGLVFYDKEDREKITGALPFMEVAGASLKAHEFPGTFTVATHRISAWTISVFYGHDKKLFWDPASIDCATEAQVSCVWIFFMKFFFCDSSIINRTG